MDTADSTSNRAQAYRECSSGKIFTGYKKRGLFSSIYLVSPIRWNAAKQELFHFHVVDIHFKLNWLDFATRLLRVEKKILEEPVDVDLGRGEAHSRTGHVSSRNQPPEPAVALSDTSHS